MKILWVTSHSGLVRLPNGQMTANQASARLRMCIPGGELIRRGNEVFYVTMQEAMDVVALLDQAKPDTVIFCKSEFIVNEGLLQESKRRSIRVVFDICDNHFVNHIKGAHYRFMAQHADIVTCSTRLLLEVVEKETRRPCLMVEDPYEGIEKPPHFSPAADKLKLLWFGNLNNLGGLYEIITQLPSVLQRTAVELVVLTTVKPTLLEDMRSITQQTGGRLQARALDWTAALQSEMLAWSDLSLVPFPKSYQSTPKISAEGILEFMRAKSPNRVVEPLRAGRMVVAHPKDSYEPFREFAWIGEDMMQGIHWCLDHATEIPARIAAGQAYIERHHSPSVIADQWEKALKLEVKVEA